MNLARHHLDQKSLQAVTGNTADWNEIAKHCSAFANATGNPLLVWYLVQSTECTQATCYETFARCHERCENKAKICKKAEFTRGK